MSKLIRTLHTRRRLMSWMAAAPLTGLSLASTARAQGQPAQPGPLRGRVTRGELDPMPIAIPEFQSDDPRLGRDIADVVAADLGGSGLFRPLDRASYITRVASIETAPRVTDWQPIGAEALVTGRVGRQPDGRLRVEYRLWDVATARPLAGQQFTLDPRNWRRPAHLVADGVYEKLLGEKGYFDTRVVFIDETGPKDRRRKRLAIMDQDGANVRYLSMGDELVLTPRFSPTAQEIVYMSYAREVPRVVLMNLDTGHREVVGDMPGMTFAPRFSPDGQRIVMSVQDGSASSLVEMDLRSRRLVRLTQGPAIDTGPCYAPDGRRLVFESDREGNQQLYVMSAEGGTPRRISANAGRYSTPVWSPRGDYIAFTKQAEGRFSIGVMKPDGSDERILTGDFHCEGPTWAPNGRVLMFFRDHPGANGGPRIYSIDLTGYHQRQIQTPSFASDPAWSPSVG